MIKVSLIGNGNVSHHLASAFNQSSTVELVQIYSRKTTHAGKFIDDLTELVPADVYLIAVSDDAVADISSQLPFADRLVVHTSGSVSLTAVDAKNRRGVFYPLQTFSKQKLVDWNEIPICIESEKDSDLALLEQLANAISRSVYIISSEQRKALHVAAVFASNFTNHMYAIAYRICTDNGIAPDILQPLIAETADKIKTLPPHDAQTGPAIRNDSKTIAAHLELLSDPIQKNIYKTLTESIQHNGKKL